MIFTTICALVAVWLLKQFVERMIAVQRVLRSFGDVDRRSYLFSRNSPGREVIWLNPFGVLPLVVNPFYPRGGALGHIYSPFTAYKKNRSSLLTSVVAWSATPSFWIADPIGIRDVLNDRQSFTKDLDQYEVINVYGPNVVSTEGSDWKRHRAIANPAFSESNIRLVWSESVRVIHEWFDHLGPDNGDFTIDIEPVMIQATLLVISAAGFGRRISWSDAESRQLPSGHTMTFHSALTSSIKALVVRFMTRGWVYKLSTRGYIPFVSPMIKRADTSFQELRSYMIELISTSRAWVVAGKHSKADAALLNNLVEANMSQDDITQGLTDDELLSDAFLLAGHETSAHRLTFALMFMALYPEAQQKLYNEAISLWPPETEVSRSKNSFPLEFPKLAYTTAALHETLRLIPAVGRLGKDVSKETTVSGTRFTLDATGNYVLEDSQRFHVQVPVGSLVLLDILAVHLNPLFWGEDTSIFKPERFIDTDKYRWPRDACTPVLAFSAGGRSCIGQRFAITESVCLLANIVRRYEILIPEELNSKSFEEQRKLMLRWVPGLTATPTNALVRLRLRTK